MTILVRRIAWGLFATGIAVCAILFFIYRIGSGISASTEHKSAKTASATVVSVAPLQETNPPILTSDTQSYRICFEIDDFDQVESDVREGYRVAEAQRLSRNGPRCKLTSKAALAKNIRVGDKVSVVYLLENEYQIDVVSVSAFSEDL